MKTARAAARQMLAIEAMKVKLDRIEAMLAEVIGKKQEENPVEVMAERTPNVEPVNVVPMAPAPAPVRTPVKQGYKK